MCWKWPKSATISGLTDGNNVIFDVTWVVMATVWLNLSFNHAILAGMVDLTTAISIACRGIFYTSC